MKIIHEFDPFEDKETLELYRKAPDYSSALWEAAQQIRNYFKYGELDDDASFEEKYKKVNGVLLELREVINSSGIWND